MALSFRSAASSTARRFSGVIAASLMAATSAVAPIPAAARDIEGLPPQCAKAGNELAQLKCGRAVFQKRIADAKARGVTADAERAAAEARSADAKARGAEADARAAEADKEGICLKAIMTDLEGNGPKTASLTEPPRKGEACKLARSLKLVAG